MRHITALLTALFLSTILRTFTFLVTDPDSLYHIAYTSFLYTSNIFQTPLPWIEVSIIHLLGVDLWYGFHLLLIPFAFISDPLTSFWIASIMVTALAFFIYYLAFYFMRSPYPLAWALLTFLSSSQFLLRATMLRPHVLTTALSTLLLPALLYMQPWTVFTITFFIAFMHSTNFWMPLSIIIAVCFISLVMGEKMHLKKYSFALAGLLLGLLARPDAGSLFSLLRIVLIDIQTAKWSSVPLSIGTEIKPMETWMFAQQYLPIAILISGIVFYCYRHYRKYLLSNLKTQTFLSSAMIASSFLLLMLLIARRFVDISNAYLFMTLSVALAPSIITLEKQNHKLLYAVSISMITLLAVYAGFLFSREVQAGTDPALMQKPAFWLKEHTQPGEIVFHAHWDEFPNLLFWNAQNHYISGLDPILMYSVNPALYYKQLYYAIDKATEYTCGASHCKLGEVTPTRKALKEDFKSSYIFLDIRRNPNLVSYLSNTPEYTQVYQDTQFYIFRINPSSP